MLTLLFKHPMEECSIPLSPNSKSHAILSTEPLLLVLQSLTSNLLCTSDYGSIL